MKRKEILLLDEPTAGLSPVAARKILDSISVILSRSKVSMLIVEHNLKNILSVVNKVLIMVNGRVEKEFAKEKLNTHEIEHLFFDNN